MHPKGRSKRSPVRCKRCPGEIPVMWLLCAAKVPGHIAHVLKLTVTIGCCIMLHYDPGPKICGWITEGHWWCGCWSPVFRNLQNLESCTFPETYTIKGVNEDQWSTHGPIRLRSKGSQGGSPWIPRSPSRLGCSLSGCSSAYKLVLTPSNSRINININIYII